MSHTRELHIVSGELNILKRTLSPLHSMINALRDYRPTRRAANLNPLLAGVNPLISMIPMPGGSTPEQFRSQTPDQILQDKQERGHGADISMLSKLYLADVADHVLILTEEIDMLRGTVENMINMVVCFPI
jgi:hypothetical protein